MPANEWHASFDEDAYGAGYIVLQRGEDDDSREVFDSFTPEQVEAVGPVFDRLLAERMTLARHEASARNANDDRAAIVTGLHQD